MSEHIHEVSVDDIRINGGTQSRVEIDDEAIESYAELAGKKDESGKSVLPPVLVYFDGTRYWLVDGFHRWHAYRKAGVKKVVVECRPGSRRDAILASLRVNATQGMRRTNADKRKAVDTILDDQEWGKWSTAVIARLCAVSQQFVSKIKGEREIRNAVAEPDVNASSSNLSYHNGRINEDKPDSGAKNSAEANPSPSRVTVTRTSSGGKAHTYEMSTSGGKKAAEPAEPGKPWSEFEAQVREVVTTLRGASKRLGEICGLDGEKKFMNKWAHGISYGGTISAINQVIRGIEGGLPAEECNEPPGFITRHRLEILKKSKPAA